MLKKWMLLLLLPPLFLTACRDSKDPEDREYIITIGVDAAEEGYRFSLAPAHQEPESTPYFAESASLAGAVAQVDCRSSRRTDLGQLKTIIFSRALLEDAEKCRLLLRELEESPAVSQKVMLLAAEDAAACVQAVLQEDSGLFLWDFYKNTAQEVAVTQAMDLDTFCIEWRERAGCAVLPRISAEGEGLRLGGGIAIGRRGIYPLDAQEERGYLFLQGKAEGALLDGAAGSCKIEKSRVRYAFAEDAFGRIRCSIFLPLEGTLTGDVDAAYFETRIKEEIRHTIAIAQEAGEDFCGILPQLSRLAPQLAAGRTAEELLAALDFEILPEIRTKGV